MRCHRCKIIIETEPAWKNKKPYCQECFNKVKIVPSRIPVGLWWKQILQKEKIKS